MNIHKVPDAIEKLVQLGDVTQFEPAGDQPAEEKQHRANAKALLPCVSEVSTPTGKKPILKAMLTTACEKNCYYCPFRAGRSSTDRISFKPDEMAGAFNKLESAKLVDGIFLSSGIIKGGMTTQDKIIDTAEILRRNYHYQGYIHLKIMPGAQFEQVRRAMQLADRVSINLEGPTPERLNALAPKKDFLGDLLERVRWTHQIRQAERVRARATTQLVVGAVGDTDLELLSLSEKLYRDVNIQRAYYSAFFPISDTPFENLNAVDLRREHRLYQSSFLLRDYGWDFEELPFMADGNLPLNVDPKRVWADAHLLHQPVEIMTASRPELLRVPGIGPRGADAILKARRQGHITDLSHLRAIGIRTAKQAAPYILLDGHPTAHQQPLIPLDDIPVR